MASTISLASQQPVATPVTNTLGKTFAANYYKLVQANLSERDRLTIRIMAMVYAYKATHDYTVSGGHKLLMSDGAVFTHGISNFDLNVALATTDWWAGYNTDNTLTNDPVAILKEGQDFKAMSEQELQRILIFLKVQLGQ